MIKSKKYTKRPVTIEAIEFEYSKEGIAALKEFCGDALFDCGKDRHPKAVGWAHIGTLEDGKGDYQVDHMADEGDFIIKGVEGEFYPCKPNIFWKTYYEGTHEE